VEDIKKLFLLFLTFILCEPDSYGQNKKDYWFFGDKVCIVFDNDTVYGDNVLNSVHFDEGNGQLNDSDGNVILLSDYGKVYDGQGNTIVDGLFGFSGSTQSSIILRHPDNDSFIYIFTNDVFDEGEGLRMTQLIRSNNSYKVVVKNKTLINRGTEKLNAVNHQNGRDIWVTSHSFGDNNFHSFLITKSGLLPCRVISSSGTIIANSSSWFGAQGQLKFSPNGTIISMVSGNINNSALQLFRFDNNTGLIQRIFESYHIIPYGCEFSKSGAKLYLSDFKGKRIFQYNLSSLDSASIVNSQRKIIDIPLEIYQQMQLGIDGRIYVAIKDSFYVGAIENPEDTGISCNFNSRAVYMGKANKSLGLPNFNQSRYYTPPIDYKYEQNCVSNNIQFWGKDTFHAISHTWQIKKSGKPAEATYTTKNINHTFADTGMYDVRYIASSGSRQDTITKIITLYPKINKHFLGKDTVYAKGDAISKMLKAPFGMHCQLWQDSSCLSTFTADTAGVYYCKVINQSFCEVTDTIVISECINNLTTPSIFRKKDTLFTYQALADSFVWYRNNVQYKVTKESFIKLTDTGHYRVEAAKKGHCNRSSSTNWVNKLGLKGITLSDLNICLYPNPSEGEVFILSGQDFKLQVFDVTGKLISKTGNIKNISLPKGVYFFCFEADGYRVTEKVVVL
jgi:hypothetical protein